MTYYRIKDSLVELDELYTNYIFVGLDENNGKFTIVGASGLYLLDCKVKVIIMSSKYWHTKSSRRDKITWLLNHQHLWEGWQDIGDPRKRGIFDQMVKDGLVSKNTYWRDLNLTRLINDTRRLRGGRSI
jgi:hypothetical protein